MTGFWGARVIGVPESAAGEPAPAPVIAQLGDRRDPGYWSTARMVLEAGLTLALSVRHLPVCPPLQRALCQAALSRQHVVHVHASTCTVVCSAACDRVGACSIPGTRVSTRTSMSCIIPCCADVRAWAWQEGELKATGRQPGGVLTAASALGMPLVQRLRNAGFTFEIKE